MSTNLLASRQHVLEPLFFDLLEQWHKTNAVGQVPRVGTEEYDEWAKKVAGDLGYIMLLIAGKIKCTGFVNGELQYEWKR